MDNDTAEAVRKLTQRLADAELRGRILAYAFRGVVSQLNPNAFVAARRMANTAVLANCPPEDRARRLEILMDVFPEARDRTQDGDWIPERPNGP